MAFSARPSGRRLQHDVGRTLLQLDAEGALWALTNGSVDAPTREIVRVVGHTAPTGDATLEPTERVTWALVGQVLGGGMRFLDR